MALVYTLQKISYKTESGAITTFYLPFGEIRDELKDFRDRTPIVSGRETIRLTKDKVDRMSNFLLFYTRGVNELDTYEFENALSSGVFMNFDIEKGIPVYNNFCRMLHQLIEEINRVKKFVHDFPSETQQKMVDSIRNYHKRTQEIYEFDFLDLGMLSYIYERLINIQNISFYLVNCITSNNKDSEPPLLLNGLVDMGKPSESDIMRIFDEHNS